MKRLEIALALLVWAGTAYADQCDNIANCIDNPTTTTLNFQTANGTGTAPGLTNYTNGVIYNDAPLWAHYLGTGAEADPGPTSFSVQGVHHYAALTINAGQTITVTSVISAVGAATDKPNGGFVALVRGTCTIAGTIAANGVFAQTSNFGGASSGGGGFGAANGVTGNSTSLPGDGGAVALATAGAQGTTGVAATAGSTPTVGSQNDVLMNPPAYGNCGGATGGAGGSSGGAGGQGGGCVVLICNNINFTGTINVAGAAGGAGGSNVGPGGGGGGGFVILAARTLTNSGTITTTAGAAGTPGSGTATAAAAGGAGWSKTFTLN